MNSAPPIVSVHQLSKTYAGGHQALQEVSMDIKEGEILALLGPNGAGKTTLISIICGIVNASSGSVTVGGHDIVKDFRITRSLIGLVPQELTIGAFESVWNTFSLSRGLFGKKKDDAFLTQLLTDLSLIDKKNSQLMSLSGGMKRRVLIGKALAHEPKILFLDEPTAGVDVELRKDMWKLVERLRQSGVTIILTTHYIEEAEAIADRIGVIDQGKLLVLDDKHTLMKKLGEKHLVLDLLQPIEQIPHGLQKWPMELSTNGLRLTYNYVQNKDENSIAELLREAGNAGLQLQDINTKQSTLEEIFIDLVKKKP